MMWWRRTNGAGRPEESPIPRGTLPLEQAPDAIWKSIEAQLDAPVRQPVQNWRWGVAAVLMAGIAVVWFAARLPRAAWDVVHVAGSKETPGRVAEGEWLETGADGRARIAVGSIGVVELEPDTRVRLVVASPQEHRLELGRGEIAATITAPPRLFFVNTPAAVAVDLGCAYRMKSDEAGNGLLRVTSGWVALERSGGEALVPAGASCRIDARRGPGTPYFEDAPEALRTALERFDADRSGLDAVLAAVRVRDTLSLWHVLSRTSGVDRERVFDRMTALTPLPQGVTRENALRLDPDTLRHWREELAWTW